MKQGADIRFDIRKRVPIAKGATLSIARPYSAQTRVSAEDFNALIESDQREERVFMNVNYVQLPPVNDFYVRVFINLPNASVQTPTDDIHYAGSFAFFGVHTDDHRDHGEHHAKTDFLVNITDTVRSLKRLNMLSADAPLSVQLVAVPTTRQFIRPDMELALEEIEFIVSPIINTRQFHYCYRRQATDRWQGDRVACTS